METVRFHGWTRLVVEVDTSAGTAEQGGVELRYSLPAARDPEGHVIPPERDTHGHVVSDVAVYRRMLVHKTTAEGALLAIVLEAIGERRLQTKAERKALLGKHVFHGDAVLAEAAAAVPPAPPALLRALAADIARQHSPERLAALAD